MDRTKFRSVWSDKKAILFDGKTEERVCNLGDPAKKEAHSGGIYGVSSIYVLLNLGIFAFYRMRCAI